MEQVEFPVPGFFEWAGFPEVKSGPQGVVT